MSKRAAEGNQTKRGARRFGGKSLRVRVVMLVMLCYLLPAFILGAYTRMVLLPAMQRNTETAITSSAGNAVEKTEKRIESVVDLARAATYDGTLTEIWSQWEADRLGDTEFLRRSRAYLEQKYSRDQLIQYAIFYPLKRPDLMASAGTDRNETAVTMEAVRDRMLEMSEELDTQTLFMQIEEEMYLARNLLNLRMERFGMLALKIDPERVMEPLMTMAQDLGGAVAIGLDQYGEGAAAWAEASQGLTDDRRGKRLDYVSRSLDKDYDLRVRLTLDRTEIYRNYYLYRRLTMAIFLALIPLLIIIMRYTRRRMIRPIEMMADAARRIEAGELGVTVPMRGEDELGRLGNSFSRMSLRIEELINRTYKEEIELKNAQILALQSRINPHFINNALEDINWMARIEGAESVSSMVTSLSVLLNAAMSRDNRRVVSLREEMNVAEAYIYFAVQRFGSNLEIRKEINDDALECTLPLMTVQPLMENSVEHGIAPAGNGRITIRARREAGALRLEIANTGKPMDLQDWEKINTALRGENAGPHLGLANIVNRLRLIYGDQVQISVDAEEETVVRILVPQKDAREGEDT
ncbi:MAG: histidine kinase [Clostridia bacterium]|nr:histidine kinase [Clostridia bacterium]